MGERISSLSMSSQGPQQTPHNEFGRTLARTLASGTSAAMDLAAPVVGGLVSPALSAAITQGSQRVSSFATGSLGSTAIPGSLSTRTGADVVGSRATGTPVAGAQGHSAAATEDPTALAGGSSADIIKATQQMNEQSQAFNMQYLQLQDQMQAESRQYQTLSNVMKVRHDTAKNAISNIH
jgi:hypothetical protein